MGQKEREIDLKVRCCLSFKILNNNLGFKSYVSTIKVLKMEVAEIRSEGDGGESDGGVR